MYAFQLYSDWPKGEGEGVKMTAPYSNLSKERTLKTYRIPNILDFV